MDLTILDTSDAYTVGESFAKVVIMILIVAAGVAIGRGGRKCPRCGRGVQVGKLECRRCGFDFERVGH